MKLIAIKHTTEGSSFVTVAEALADRDAIYVCPSTGRRMRAHKAGPGQPERFEFEPRWDPVAPNDFRISVLVPSNPKKRGSMAWQRFELYRPGMTVGEFIAAGGRREDIRYDMQHEFIGLWWNLSEAA